MALKIFDLVFELYWWILIIRFLITWLPDLNYSHPVLRYLFMITDPVIRPFQGIIPPFGQIDVSPIIVFLVLRLIYASLRHLLVILI